MQHFQSILIVVGLLAIGGVLIHGYLLSRKEKASLIDAPNNVDIFAEKTSPEPDVTASDEIISDVRIISREVEQEEATIDFTLAVNDEQVAPAEFNEEAVDNEEQIKEPLVTSIEADNSTQQTNFVEFEELEVNIDEALDEPIMAEDIVTTEEVIQPQDLFIFNVVAKEDTQLGGHELLQFFLTSGFRFGEMSIFHRHEHSDGTGPILFSIANMMAPGVFDPDNMEQFKSEGVSFFLTAPNTGIDVKASFEMMLRAVEQMAEEFDCIVLNAQREPMTEEQFIEYNHRLLHYI